MARTSLGVGCIAVCSASCLVTSSPEFENPEQTPPVLIAESAKPDVRVIQVIEPSQGKVTFSADVTSAEDLGQNIRVKMYVDYGVELFAGEPFAYVFNGAPLLPGNTGQPRVAQVDVDPGRLTAGCHTLTLMVSHAFDDLTECPLRLDDSSQLTWHVLVCPPTGPCPPPIDDPRFDCPSPTTQCPDVADGAGQGGGGGSVAP